MVRLEVVSISLFACPSSKDVISDVVSDGLQQIVVFATFLLFSLCTIADMLLPIFIVHCTSLPVVQCDRGKLSFMFGVQDDCSLHKTAVRILQSISGGQQCHLNV